MIVGKKIYLRPVEASDHESIIALNSDPGVRGNVVGWDWPSSLHRQSAWFESAPAGNTYRWVVCDSDDVVVGLTGLWDVNWHDRNALTAVKLGGPRVPRGQGWGVDAIKAVMAFAFYDVGLERLYGSILVGNDASKRAYCDRCGWTVEGLARSHVWRHGSFVDVEHVAVLKRDFDQLNDAQEYVALIQTGHL